MQTHKEKRPFTVKHQQSQGQGLEVRGNTIRDTEGNWRTREDGRPWLTHKAAGSRVLDSINEGVEQKPRVGWATAGLGVKLGREDGL